MSAVQLDDRAESDDNACAWLSALHRIANADLKRCSAGWLQRIARDALIATGQRVGDDREASVRKEHSFTCPRCGSHAFGTSNLAADPSAWTVYCHGENCATAEHGWTGWYGPYNDHVTTLRPR